jgi:predicted lactoylglutathione lyase
MDQRISIITLGVSDLKKSKEFYDSLGWKIANEGDESEEIVTYNIQSMAFALYPLEKLSEDATVPAQMGQYSTMTIAHNVDSEAAVDEVIEQARAIGAKIVKEPQKVFWGGYSSYFADPDGYLWEIAYNPFSKLGKNGEFQWGGVEN